MDNTQQQRLYPLTLLGTSVVALHDLRRVHGDSLGMMCWARAVAENAVMPASYVHAVDLLLMARWPNLPPARREYVRWDFYNRYMQQAYA